MLDTQTSFLLAAPAHSGTGQLRQEVTSMPVHSMFHEEHAYEAKKGADEDSNDGLLDNSGRGGKLSVHLDVLSDFMILQAPAQADALQHKRPRAAPRYPRVCGKCDARNSMSRDTMGRTGRGRITTNVVLSRSQSRKEAWCPKRIELPTRSDVASAALAVYAWLGWSGY